MPNPELDIELLARLVRTVEKCEEHLLDFDPGVDRFAYRIDRVLDILARCRSQARRLTGDFALYQAEVACGCAPAQASLAGRH